MMDYYRTRSLVSQIFQRPNVIDQITLEVLSGLEAGLTWNAISAGLQTNFFAQKVRDLVRLLEKEASDWPQGIPHGVDSPELFGVPPEQDDACGGILTNGWSNR